MAGDWIKMGKDLLTHPKVVRISSALRADKLRTVGGLFAVWCLFDTHSVDGQLSGYTAETIDEEIRFPGFSDAMQAVGWLNLDADGASLPDFEEHNGQSAKRRAQETERKRTDRKVSASNADKKRTREEKRREEREEEAPCGDALAVDADASEVKTTRTGLLCKRIRQEAKLMGVNPMDPRLIALVESGFGDDEIFAVCQEAQQKGKGWAWAFTVVQERRKEAATVKTAPAATAPAFDRSKLFRGAI